MLERPHSFHPPPVLVVQVQVAVVERCDVARQQASETFGLEVGPKGTCASRPAEFELKSPARKTLVAGRNRGSTSTASPVVHYYKFTLIIKLDSKVAVWTANALSQSRC